jgi:multicomponent K+:H+ antiporter subunit G
MNPLPIWLDVLLAVLIVVGAGFSVIGSFGLARLSDFLKRVHGPTKASTLGVGCVLIASAAYFTAGGLSTGDGASLHELMITLFVFLTAPVSAQLLVKAALKLDPTIRPPAPPAGDQAARRSGSKPS